MLHQHRRTQTLTHTHTESKSLILSHLTLRTRLVFQPSGEHNHTHTHGLGLGEVMLEWMTAGFLPVSWRLFLLYRLCVLLSLCLTRMLKPCVKLCWILSRLMSFVIIIVKHRSIKKNLVFSKFLKWVGPERFNPASFSQGVNDESSL